MEHTHRGLCAAQSGASAFAPRVPRCLDYVTSSSMNAAALQVVRALRFALNAGWAADVPPCGQPGSNSWLAPRLELAVCGDAGRAGCVQVMDKQKEGQAGMFERSQETGRINSLSVVLSQEIDRFNRLTRQMRLTLQELQKAIQGVVVMSGELERMLHALLDSQVRPCALTARHALVPRLPPPDDCAAPEMSAYIWDVKSETRLIASEGAGEPCFGMPRRV